MSALLRTSVARTALRTAPASRRSLVTLKERLYVVEGIADSAGRNGTVTSPQSKSLTLKLSTPKSLGGAEDAHNPEQLFAMGYAGERSAFDTSSYNLMYNQLASPARSTSSLVNRARKMP